MWRNCFKIKKWETLKQIRDKDKLFLAPDLHVYDLFKLIFKIIRRSCGNKNLSEQEKTDTINRGNTRIKLRSRNRLTTRAKNEIENWVSIGCVCVASGRMVEEAKLGAKTNYSANK